MSDSAFIDLPLGVGSVCRHNRSMYLRTRPWVAALWLWAVALPASAALPDADIAVRVTKAGSDIVVVVDCPVNAPASVVWEVLTDYDNMAAYVSNLEFSGVLNRIENVLTVRQRGKATRGPLTFEFDMVREIVLVPFLEIRSRLISGDLKASVFTTRIVDGDGLVHISNSGRYTPNVWVPPFIGPALIEGETRKQYAEIRTEILRRALRRTAQLTTQQAAR